MSASWKSMLPIPSPDTVTLSGVCPKGETGRPCCTSSLDRASTMASSPVKRVDRKTFCAKGTGFSSESTLRRIGPTHPRSCRWICFVFDLAGVAGLCTKRCEVEFLFVFIWVVDRKTTLRRPVARCVDLLTDGMAVLFVDRVTNLRCRPAARCVDLLTVGIADFCSLSELSICGQVEL